MKRRLQRGISIVEVLVAAILLGLAIYFITPLVSYSLKQSQVNKERSAAVQAGQRIVESVRNAGFDGANAIVNSTTPTTIQLNDLQGQSLYIKQTGEILTAPATGAKLLQVQRLYTFSEGDTPAPSDDLIQVTVKITWPGSASRHVTMGTTLARSGALN